MNRSTYINKMSMTIAAGIFAGFCMASNSAVAAGGVMTVILHNTTNYTIYWWENWQGANALAAGAATHVDVATQVNVGPNDNDWHQVQTTNEACVQFGSIPGYFVEYRNGDSVQKVCYPASPFQQVTSEAWVIADPGKPNHVLISDHDPSQAR